VLVVVVGFAASGWTSLADGRGGWMGVYGGGEGDGETVTLAVAATATVVVVVVLWTGMVVVLWLLEPS